MKTAFIRGYARKIIDEQFRVKKTGAFKRAAGKTRKLNISLFKGTINKRGKIKK